MELLKGILGAYEGVDFVALMRDMDPADLRAAYEAVCHPDIETHQRRIITKLRNNPSATEIEDLSFDGTAGAVFELPVWAISFLTRKRKGNPNAAEHLAKARQVRELPLVTTKSGSEAA